MEITSYLPSELWVRIAACDFDVWQALLKTSVTFWKYTKRHKNLLRKTFGNIIALRPYMGAEFEEEIFWMISRFNYREDCLPCRISDSSITWYGGGKKTQREFSEKPGFITGGGGLYFGESGICELDGRALYRYFPSKESSVEYMHISIDYTNIEWKDPYGSRIFIGSLYITWILRNSIEYVNKKPREMVIDGGMKFGNYAVYSNGTFTF